MSCSQPQRPTINRSSAGISLAPPQYGDIVVSRSGRFAGFTTGYISCCDAVFLMPSYVKEKHGWRKNEEKIKKSRSAAVEWLRKKCPSCVFQDWIAGISLPLLPLQHSSHIIRAVPLENIGPELQKQLGTSKISALRVLRQLIGSNLFLTGSSLLINRLDGSDLDVVIRGADAVHRAQTRLRAAITAGEIQQSG